MKFIDRVREICDNPKKSEIRNFYKQIIKPLILREAIKGFAEIKSYGPGSCFYWETSNLKNPEDLWILEEILIEEGFMVERLPSENNKKRGKLKFNAGLRIEWTK